MDGSSVEHSDSDSGESWTLLENNSIYADDPPEFIDGREKHEAHHDKDEDTDGISIISDSDHEASTPPPGETVYEKLQDQSENNLLDKDISDFVSVDPHLIDSKEHEPAKAEVITDENHIKHKTYVHRRNKQLSTALNIIVLGSVITAAGMAIGHMWGAKNDCTMQTTSSINKILSNLYKLQEENAYLRGKLKELTSHNNHQNQHQRISLKNNKCRKVFEESLNNNDPRKITKCIDINNNADSLIERMTTPKFEKEFIADMDKLKSVYLQNKSWLDDEISRRMKIEEELLKKYNDEVNSAKERKQTVDNKNTKPVFLSPDLKVHKVVTLENVANLNNFNSDNLGQKKISYADSLKSEQKPMVRRNEERYDTDEEKWLVSKQQLNFIDQDIDKPEQKTHSQLYENKANAPDCVNYMAESVQEPGKKPNKQFIHTINLSQERTENYRKGDFAGTEDENWSKTAQETKNKRKKEKRGNVGNLDNFNSDNFGQNKISNADSLKSELKPTVRRNEERYDTDEDKWLVLKQQLNFIDQDIDKPEQKAHPQLYENRANAPDYVNYLAESVQEPGKKLNKQFIRTINLSQERTENYRKGDFAGTEDDNWSKTAQETKNKRKKEKRGNNVGDLDNFNSDNFGQNKIYYADSLKSEQKPMVKRNEERYDTDEDKWLVSKQQVNFIDQDIDKPEHKTHPQLYENRANSPDYVNYLAKSNQEPGKKPNKQFTHEINLSQERTENYRKGDFAGTEDENWSKTAQQTKNKRKKEKRGNVGNLDNFNSDNFGQNKISNADSLKSEQKPMVKRNEERYDTDEDKWLVSKQQHNFIDQDIDKPEQEAQPQLYENRINAPDYFNYLAESDQEPGKKPNKQFIHAINLSQERTENYRKGDFAENEDDNWSKTAQETKNKRKKEKRGKKRNAKKQILEDRNDQSAGQPTEYKENEEEFMKDDRYVTNKLNKDKKKNGYVNSNKKQKRKNKLEKWNMKGEFGDKFEAVKMPDDYALNYPEKNNNYDYDSFTNYYDSDRTSETIVDTEETLGKKTFKEQPSTWFEKRAVFRNEARKKFYEQFGATTLNNSSWYFRRMRKREQCRTRGDNSTYKKYRKEIKSDKMKQ